MNNWLNSVKWNKSCYNLVQHQTQTSRYLFLFGAVGLSPVVLSGGGWQHVAGHWQDLGHRGSTSFVWSLEQRWLRETCHVPSHLDINNEIKNSVQSNT